MTQLTDRLALLGEAQDAQKELEGQLAEKAQSLEAAETKIAEMLDHATEQEKALTIERDENKRLEECVASADSVTGKRETERRQLSEQFTELKARNQHLEAQLAERSNLVVGLEQEKTEINSKTSSLEDENSRLSRSLEKSQRHAGEHAEHITQLDSHLERQKDLMENLEKEFAQVQEEYAQAIKAHSKEQQQKDAAIAARDEELAAIRQEFESGSSNVSNYEERVSTLKSDLEKARSEVAEKVAEAESVGHENARNKSQEDAARSALTEKIESLEKQLRKQTKATAKAEKADSSARADLKILKTEYARDSSAEDYKLLQNEAKKLESMVQERTEQLNEIKWQQEMAAQPQGESGEKLLVVLNQQLAAARTDNDRLLERIRELDGRAGAGSGAGSVGDSSVGSPDSSPVAQSAEDDLSRIHGVGPKLVAQLKELGIDRFDQIACLNEADLDDEAHVLHPFKKRLERDDWISQAAILANAT
jgi:chromosome segregation ATPase